MRRRTNGINMKLKLISLVEQTVHTTLLDIFVSNNTLIMIRMVAVEMFGLESFGNAELARPARLLTAITRDSIDIVLVEELLVGVLNHTLSDEHDVDGMGEVGQNGDKGFGHFAAHIKVLILVLQQINSMRNLAVRRKVLHDLTVDKKEDLNLVLREVRIDILVIKLDG